MQVIEYVKRTFPEMWENRTPHPEGPTHREGTKFHGCRTHTRAAVYTLTKIIRPKKVLEIGSMGYMSSSMMATAMCEHGINGEVHSIDIRRGGYNGRHQENPSTDLVTPLFWLPHHTPGDDWKHDAPIEHPEFKNMDDDEIFAQNCCILSKVAPKGGYDMIFIDGDHSYEGVSWDWKYAQRFSHEGTIFVIDDLGDDRHDGVMRFWNELDGVHKVTFDDWNDKAPQFYIGMGLCQKNKAHS